jgi:molybdopterin synthase sulfur carrier subunit
MATIKLFGNLREYATSPVINVPGETVGEVLRLLCADNQDLSTAVFDDQNLRPYVRVMVGGHDIELAQGLDTPVSETDSIAVFPPIAGGCENLGYLLEPGRSVTRVEDDYGTKNCTCR